MSQLAHLFAKGLRFDSDLSYQLRDRQGRPRFRSLPGQPRKTGTSGRLKQADLQRDFCLAQCLAVVGQTPFPYAQRQIMQQLAGVTLVENAFPVEKCSFLDYAGQALTLSHRPIKDAFQFGADVLEFVRDGDVCAVQFEMRSQLRWAVITGVEWMPATQCPRALLLLDPALGEPWACGHNARIELHALERQFDGANVAVNSRRAKNEKSLVYRGLASEGGQVYLQSLVTVLSCSSCNAHQLVK